MIRELERETRNEKERKDFYLIRESLKYIWYIYIVYIVFFVVLVILLVCVFVVSFFLVFFLSRTY